MKMQVNVEQCTGCGACVEICPTRAIHMSDGLAILDQATCTQCQACVDTCPEGAITAIELPVVAAEPVAVQPVREPEIVFAEHIPSSPKPWLSAALVLAVWEILPRLADALVTALERRLAQPTTTAIAPITMSSLSHTARGKGDRRQARYCGGRTGNRNPKERR